MRTYFLVKVKYEKTVEEGKIASTSEIYLLDAISFTEAEKKIIEEMKPFISGEFSVETLKREKISELILNESGEYWFKARVAFISLDEEKGIEKRTRVNMYIQADDMQAAKDSLTDHMKSTLADYQLEKIEETKIVDYYPFIPQASTD